jgi:hypothetical protein
MRHARKITPDASDAPGFFNVCPQFIHTKNCVNKLRFANIKPRTNVAEKI